MGRRVPRWPVSVGDEAECPPHWTVAPGSGKKLQDWDPWGLEAWTSTYRLGCESERGWSRLDRAILSTSFGWK